MSEAKHTPGPWEVLAGDWDKKLDGFCRYTISPLRLLTMADARLMAAGPDSPHYCTDPDCKGGKLMRELEALTPGGSEFVGDVERCIDFIKHAREMDIKKWQVMGDKLRAVKSINTELLEALKAVAPHMNECAEYQQIASIVHAAIAKAEERA